MLADIITIGDEILIGQIVDTNSAWMGKELNKIGISIRQITSISDNKQAITDTLSESIKKADVIFITGGLGPTKDDITKHTLCQYFDGNLVIHQEALKNIEHFISLKKGEMNENNKNQALFPDNALFIPNTNGTASGIWFEKQNKIIISMPGVPHEMTKMMSEHIIPRLTSKFHLPIIAHQNIITTGIAEAKLAELLTEWESDLPHSIKLAYLPSPGLVKLRLSSSGDNLDILKTQIDKQIEKLEKIIPSNISSYEDKPLELLIGELLKKNNLTLSTAESCTGGNIAAKITSQAGSSAYFKGSIVAYSNEIKEKLLHVPHEIIEEHGAVSESVVKIMAENIRILFNTDIGISVSGIAGPSGGTIEKPVGTVWIAVCSEKKTICQQYLFENERDKNIFISTNAALSMILRLI